MQLVSKAFLFFYARFSFDSAWNRAISTAPVVWLAGRRGELPKQCFPLAIGNPADVISRPAANSPVAELVGTSLTSPGLKGPRVLSPTYAR